MQKHTFENNLGFKRSRLSAVREIVANPDNYGDAVKNWDNLYVIRRDDWQVTVDCNGVIKSYFDGTGINWNDQDRINDTWVTKIDNKLFAMASEVPVAKQKLGTGVGR